jgi:D-aspartate ligase
MQGLQAARILARRGVEVVGVARGPNHYATKTNVCERILFANTASIAVIELLEAEADRFATKPVLVPCDDAPVSIVSKYRERLSAGYHIPLAPTEVIDLLLDKERFYRYANERGLPIPTTCFVESLDDARAAAENLRFPAVIKPPNKAGRWASKTSMKAVMLQTPDELTQFYEDHQDWSDVFIAQEWIPGSESELYSCNCYYDRESKPLVTFTARKVRQWPPNVGDSSLGVECRNDDLLEVTKALFGGVGYTGLGYLEMKRDARDGRLVIMEPNIGRPTGRSAIAEAGGVDLLYTMYCDTVGLPIRETSQSYGGAKWVNLRKDAQAAIHAIRRGELTVSEWLRSWRGKKAFAVWSLSDPRPFFSDLATSLKILVTRQRREQKVL